MNTAKSNYELLIQKLDAFIRRYYLNQLIRGSLYSIALLLFLFLGLSVMEGEFRFSSEVRTILFWSFVGISALALGVWVFTPLLHYFRLGKVISHEQAAAIIGSHFGDVQDKLLNILQLKHQADYTANNELILASIQQKSEEIKLVPFQRAIDLSRNRKYLRYAVPPLLLLLLLLWAAPSLIKDSTARLVKYNQEFERPAPFRFLLPEEELTVVQYEDFPLEVKVEGEVLPNEVFIDVNNYQYRLKKVDAQTFTYRFSNVEDRTRFRLFSGRVVSPPYELEVLKKPNILGFEVQLDYPDYIGRRDEKLANTGDLVVPEGTRLVWTFQSQNTDAIALRFGGNAPEPADRIADDLFSFSKKVLSESLYKLYVGNQDLPLADSITYSLSVIPDLYPTISVEPFADSTDERMLYFLGEAADDYGLLSLTFNYRITHADGSQEDLQTQKLEMPRGKAVDFSHAFDLNTLQLAPGERVDYYFEVFDNDGVNGSKSTRTQLFHYAMPTREEMEAAAEENDQTIREKLQKSLEESRRIQQEMKRLREKLLQEKEVDWQTRKELEKLLQRQRELQKEIQDAKEAFDENLENQEQFQPADPDLQEKQEQLQKLFEETMSDEMQELMEQIEELLQELEKEGALEMMEEMEFNNQELEMELDRVLELFKQLELEQELEQALDKLEELAEQEEQLSRETEQAEEQKEQMSPEQREEKQQELEQKQEAINQQFEQLMEKMEQIEQKNEELQKPKELNDPSEKMEDINQDLQDSKEQLQQQQNRKAAKKQKRAAEKMREMSMDMQMQMQSQAMQQMEEDMETLRQLLENLVQLSFDQEDLLKDFEEAQINTPHYVELVQKQFKLKDDFRIVEDSLQALAKRVFQIESFITEKVGEIKSNLRKSLDDLEERRKPQAGEHQQRTMKNLNDLALMLSEVMEQMQMQMAGMMAGNQMCNKPGGQGKEGNVPMDKITKGQEGLNEDMQKMRKRMDQGQGGSSEEFARMAARQAALRQALREKQKQLQEQGKGSKELEDIIEQMNKIETELVNKRLTNEMLKRQQEILTRLLEHEKAERQREYDNKRKSETAQNQERRLPPSLEEYLKQREAETQQFKTVSPALKPYYKKLVEGYFKELKGTQ